MVVGRLGTFLGPGIMYLYHIMSQKKSEMIRKVYEAQNRNPAKNGWSLIVENDLKDIDFEENIENFSKTSFKKIVKEKIEKIAFKYLMNKKEKHSKLQDITYRSKFRIESLVQDLSSIYWILQSLETRLASYCGCRV